ncbi:MAG: GntR family transcriptional regulator [Armatimonadota bacterium]
MQRTFLYKEIADDLREQIGHGENQLQKLPSERTLMTRYGVQRSTVRRALSILVAEGRITSASKRGSFINPLPISSSPLSEVRTAVGTVLVVTQWNEVSTALESLLRGLRESLADTELSLLFFDSRPRQGKSRSELPTAEYLHANHVKGVVLWPESPADLQALHHLRQLAPLVLVDRQVPGFETHSVVFDDFAGGRAITEHLIALGHRRIGFLTDEVFAQTVQQRWRGYVQALENAGIAAEPTCYGLFQGMWNPPYSAQMRLLLEGAGQPLTAVVCSNDTVALDFIHFLRREGYRVPEDVAVTGFGNLLPTSMEAMRLTTVLQPFEEAGKAVGRILLSNVSSARPPNTAEYEHVEVPVQLVVRELRESEAKVI